MKNYPIHTTLRKAIETADRVVIPFVFHGTPSQHELSFKRHEVSGGDVPVEKRIEMVKGYFYWNINFDQKIEIDKDGATFIIDPVRGGQTVVIFENSVPVRAEQFA